VDSVARTDVGQDLRFGPPGRQPGSTRWTKDFWYMKYREVTRNMANPTLAAVAARMGLSERTVKRYHGLWGKPVVNTEGWELRVSIDEFRKLVNLSVQIFDENYAMTQIKLTYIQARLLREQLTALEETLL
jgi:hypothetical protein